MDELNKLPDNENMSPVVDIKPTDESGGFKFNFDRHFLPISILISGILISSSVLYANDKIGNWGNNQPSPTNNNQQQPAAGKVDIKITANDHVLGNQSAKVTIVEYADFRCPFCERFYQQSEVQMLKDYVNTGKARFVFKNYAFLGQQSTWASEAAECAADQGKFWEYHNWLYSNQASEADLAYYSKANLIKYAGKVGLNTTQFTSCLNTDKYAQRVADEMAEGQKFGVSGTPTIFINGVKIVGAQPYTVFQDAINAALAGK